MLVRCYLPFTTLFHFESMLSSHPSTSGFTRVATVSHNQVESDVASIGLATSGFVMGLGQP
jgi:hypothetical protein